MGQYLSRIPTRNFKRSDNVKHCPPSRRFADCVQLLTTTEYAEFSPEDRMLGEKGMIVSVMLITTACLIEMWHVKYGIAAWMHGTHKASDGENATCVTFAAQSEKKHVIESH